VWIDKVKVGYADDSKAMQLIKELEDAGVMWELSH
jgi:hypothetical protein